ncbi:acyltransferase domain-containing protein [Streptomyces parvus]|uniref:acyltransferase domain-containing protein n=1 Tax=Streptomyces parvus TaxID=66428 RepID=UPI0037117F31
MSARTALLFPGQGSYVPGLLAPLLKQNRRAVEVLESVDAVCAETGRAPVSPLLTDIDAPSIVDLMEERPGDLDLAMFASNLAAFEVLSAHGVHGDIFAGHSFGEISALTAAGALSVEDATHMICMRSEAFEEISPAKGGMVAMALDLRRANHLVGLLDEPDVAVAVDNGPAQCVVSGPWPVLAGAEQLASAVGGAPVRLPTAYPFHSRMLRAVNALFSVKTAEIRLSAPATPVYSAILGRYVESAADIRALADSNLTHPVMFYDGLLRLHRDGVRQFVESGVRDTLTRLATTCLPSELRAIAPFSARTTPDGLARSLEPLVDGSGVPLPVTTAPVRPSAACPASRKPPVQTQSQTSRSAHVPRQRETVEDIVRELRTVYADFLDLPEDLLDDEVDLEADLGVDSIKQIAAFDRARKQLGRQRPPENLRTSSYTTLPKLAGLIQELAISAGADA